MNNANETRIEERNKKIDPQSSPHKKNLRLGRLAIISSKEDAHARRRTMSLQPGNQMATDAIRRRNAMCAKTPAMKFDKRWERITRVEKRNKPHDGNLRSKKPNE